MTTNNNNLVPVFDSPDIPRATINKLVQNIAPKQNSTIKGK